MRREGDGTSISDTLRDLAHEATRREIESTAQLLAKKGRIEKMVRDINDLDNLLFDRESGKGEMSGASNISPSTESSSKDAGSSKGKGKDKEVFFVE